MKFTEPHNEWILTGEEWEIQRLHSWLRQLQRVIHARRAPLCACMAPCPDPLDFTSRLGATWTPVEIGAVWGKNWDYSWFRIEGVIPNDWKGCKAVARVNLGGEAAVLDSNGVPMQRITNGSVFDIFYEVDEIPLLESCAGGEKVDLCIQAWASALDGLSRPADPDSADADKDGVFEGRVKRLEVVAIDTDSLGLFHDLEVLLSAVECHEAHSHPRARLLKLMMDALYAWKDNPANSAASRAILAEAFRGHPTDLQAVVTGHAHIDTGWLWRVRDSIGKCARTFGTQLANLENNPDYVFGASSAQHYAFIADHHPKLHRRIQKFVNEGRWEIQSAMWVESDCNLPSGESLIRQFLYGGEFIRREFGVECPIAWLPDVFGLSAALPQILAQSGVRYLLTKKPHWSRWTVFPHTAFRWKGHDGSEVLVHILPQVRDYNGQARAGDFYEAARGFREKDRLDTFLYTMGVGDGGGGPSEPMLERVRRMAALEGMPRVRYGRALEVFERIESASDSLPEWQGELYVEGHRGTYTSQARLKAANRRAEIQLGQIEHLFCHLDPADYPREALARCWRAVLLNQFHDILPGSCIREVAEDALADYAKVFEALDRLKEQFAETMPQAHSGISFFNSLGCTWKGCVDTNGEALSRADGNAFPSQLEPGGKTVSLVAIQPLSFAQFSQNGTAPAATMLSEPVLENAHLQCVFDADGRMISCLDKESGSEILACGGGNKLALYVDRPIDWDAWDIDHFYPKELIAEAVAAGEWRGWTGAARSVLEFPLRIGTSHMLLRCSLNHGSRRVDFELTVDWCERHRMLRCGFETAILNPGVKSGIQHGYVERQSRPQTPHEKAKFEVPFHGYVATMDTLSGAAVLADAKYGARIEGGFVEIALLRSPTYPDHTADNGSHRISYAFLPFAGTLHFGEAQEQSDCLAYRPLVFPGRGASALKALFRIEGEGIRVEAVKRAESGDHMIVRLANIGGADSRCMVRAGSGSIHRSGLDEALGASLETREEIPMRPFELVTFALQASLVKSKSAGPFGNGTSAGHALPCTANAETVEVGSSSAFAAVGAGTEADLNSIS